MLQTEQSESKYGFIESQSNFNTKPHPMNNSLQGWNIQYPKAHYSGAVESALIPAYTEEHKKVHESNQKSGDRNQLPETNKPSPDKRNET